MNFDAKIKQRCAGALVLLLVTAIFMPFIFRNNNVNSQTIIATPLAPLAHPKPAIDQSIIREQQELAKQQAVISEQKSKHQVATKKWYLQVASFSDIHHAGQLQLKLEKLKIKSKIMKAEGINGQETSTVFRVVAGAFVSKNLAEKEQERIQKEVGLKGLLTLLSEQYFKEHARS
jgi:cell division protein FtsN